MENLWSRTSSGMFKDWDDEFDATEIPPIIYEFPYSELAKQSNATVPTVSSVQNVPSFVSPAISVSGNISSKKSLTFSDEVKDGNILKSRKTYSKRKKNPLLLSSEMPQEQGKKRKEKDLPETPCAKHSRMEQQHKISADKNLTKEIRNHSKINDNAVGKTEANVNNLPKTELTNGNSEYSLFGDIDQFFSADQSEENTTNDVKEHGLSLKEPLNTGYQRTRKNLRKQIDYRMLHSGQSREGINNAANYNNITSPPVQNTFDSSLASGVVTGNRQGAKDSDLSPSNSDEAIEEDTFFNLIPPPPKKQLSLMDMMKKYSEIKTSLQIKSKETGRRKRAPAKKASKVQKRSQSSKTTSSKFTHDTNNSNCNKLEEASYSASSTETVFSQNDKMNPTSLVISSPQDPYRNHQKEYVVKHYNHNAVPFLQLPQKLGNGLKKNGNQPAVKSRKSPKKERAPPKKRQTRTRKPKSDQCSKTKTHLKETEYKVDTDLLPMKHAQSSMSNSLIYSIHNSSQPNAQSVFNSSVCNSRIGEKVGVLQMTKTKNLNQLSSNSATSQCGQTTVENQLFYQNIEKHVPDSFSLSTNNRNSSHSQLPVASILNSASTVSNTECVPFNVQDFSKQSTLKQTVTEPLLLDNSASLYGNQSKEPDFSDSESDSPVTNRRTFAAHGADFLCFISSKMNSIGKSCVVKCLEDAEDWIAATPFSRELTVKEFCNNPNVMNVLLEFLSNSVDLEIIPDLINVPKVYYEFPEDFQNVPLFRMLKDYVDQVLIQMVSHNFSPVASSLTGLSVVQFAFHNMPYRECCIVALLFRDIPGELKLADVAAKLNFVALLVIFEEFRQREIESKF